MNLRDLELFCEVANLGSFSKAAKVHGISQPAASETVKALEERLGCDLLNRSIRPLQLTPEGRIYFDGCRQLLDGYRRLEDRILQQRDKVVGTVRVASIYSVGLLQMDCYVKEFERLYPDAALDLQYLHPEQVLDSVLNETVDLGLMSFAQRRADLIYETWQDQKIVAVVAPQHRLAKRTSIQAAELDGESLVGFTSELRIRHEIDRWLKQAKVSVNLVHAFDNIENIKRAVEVGSGLGLLPIPTVRREIEFGSLVAIEIENVDWVRRLDIVYRRSKPFTTAITRFLELLHQDPETFSLSNETKLNSDSNRSVDLNKITSSSTLPR
ncbi:MULTISPECIES: LysR family transcriptional regulator [unclassified Schlesneria]|uniref:LysR family transcriptional regulator n=1 Tax=Schlesneria TaxID=656899 RepID=UPI002F113289